MTITYANPLFPIVLAFLLAFLFVGRYSVLKGKRKRQWAKEAIVAWWVCVLVFAVTMQWIAR